MAYEWVERGSKTILSYSLEEGQKIDHDALAMLVNNDIAGIISPGYSQFDDTRILEYDVSGCTPASRYFTSYLFPRQCVLEVLQDLADALADAEDHLISLGQFELSLDKVFMADDMSPHLVCLPIEGRRINETACGFLMLAMQNMDKDPDDDFSYVSELFEYLSAAASFSLDGFRTLLGSLSLHDDSVDLEHRSHIRIAPPQPVAEQRGQGDAFHDASAPQHMPSAQASGFSSAGSAGQPSWSGSPGGMVIPPGDGAASGQALTWEPPREDGKEKSGKGLFGNLFGGSKDKPKKEKKPKKAKKAEKPQEPKEKKGGLFHHKHKDKNDLVIPFGPTWDEPADDRLPSPENSPFFSGGADIAIPGQSGGSGFSTPAVDAQQEPINASGANGSASGPSGSGRAPSGDECVEDGFGITVVKGVTGPKKKGIADGFSGKKAAGPDGEANGGSGPRPKPKGTVDDELGIDLPFAQVKRVSTGETGLIRKPRYRLGRKRSEVDFYLPNDLNISRCHAIIQYDGKDFSLADNGSSNHTFVNGEMLEVGEKRRLKSGDEFCLGNEKFVFLRA